MESVSLNIHATNFTSSWKTALYTEGVFYLNMFLSGNDQPEKSSKYKRFLDASKRRFFPTICSSLGATALREPWPPVLFSSTSL
jgi:hypothetical protein